MNEGTGNSTQENDYQQSTGSDSSSCDVLYTEPAVHRPSVDQLRSVAETLHLHISTDELQQYQCKLS